MAEEIPEDQRLPIGSDEEGLSGEIKAIREEDHEKTAPVKVDLPVDANYQNTAPVTTPDNLGAETQLRASTIS